MNNQDKSVPAGCAVLLIHPTTGFEDRGLYQAAQLGALSIEYKTIDGADAGSESLEDISSRCFSEPLLGASAAHRSCTAKHLLAYRHVVDNNLDGTLVLEDDIRLKPRFMEIFARSLEELKHWDGPVIASYEDTRLRFVPRSRRRRGQVLYPGDRDRFAGAYYINRSACEKMLEIARTRGFSRPVDLEHRAALDRGELTYLWCEPTIATQGSFNGKFKSRLNAGSKILTGLRQRFKYLYRRLLYNLR